MATLNKYTKQPADRLDYDFDYKDFLLGTDAIETVAFVVDPVGLAIDSPTHEPTYTKIWVSGGEVGTTYKISCTVSTEQGRVKQDEIKILIREY